MFSKYSVLLSSVLVTLVAAASTVDLDALLLVPGVESHNGVDTLFSKKNFHWKTFAESIAPAIVNSSIIFLDVSSGVAAGNVKSRTIMYDSEETYYDWEQYQVVTSGDWETEWAPVSECIWREEKDQGDDAPDRIPVSVPYHWVSEYSIVDYDTEANVDNIDFRLIKAVLNKRNWLERINETVSQSSIMVAPMIKSSDVLQLWYSKKMVWANAQRQYCSACLRGHQCGAWSRYYHVDAPTYDEPLAFYMIKLTEDELQCPNKRYATAVEPVRINIEGEPNFFIPLHDENEPEEKSIWNSLKKMLSKRS
ncbi:hypothetical protein SMKI_03G0200 [Saccharomyces mikatae IFO 1815]|uniref:Uncharacterized protein n=1 Tax=Saccharomyces mikatae IFO 1815 TaxID=226126 RepID=A0AA35NEB0_SACMI|nr:uncharacterized protein SMKI_03G0200 [Saccharomyces mikatae IFO 1815]CAI4037547.1 hypothetical protein SMKI_03G0200 [Saccharomyces mikatae IFO 1815]